MSTSVRLLDVQTTYNTSWNRVTKKRRVWRIFDLRSCWFGYRAVVCTVYAI